MWQFLLGLVLLLCCSDVAVLTKCLHSTDGVTGAARGVAYAAVLYTLILLCCAVLAQPVIAGYGLAQRLLVMVDAACSPAAGDPFAALTPEAPAFSATAAAAPSSGQGTGSTVCGSRCSWPGCLERLRLAHEGLLLLRALVATPGAVGESCC